MEEDEIAFVPAAPRHEGVLWHMLTYAATMTEPAEQAILKARADPYLRTYVEGFGSAEGDLGIVAEQPDGVAIGAAWLRRSHEHGSFRVGGSELPELAMGLLPSHRRRGIGTRMLGALLDTARSRYSAVALSVRETSPACRMYLRFGFVETGRMENRVGGISISMQLALNRPHAEAGEMVSVRRAEPEDAAMAVDVLRRSITELCRADHRGDAETIARWLANKTPQHFRAWLGDEDNFCAVAEANHVLLGVGLLHRNGEIRLCYLAPGAQRQGIGKAIHAALEEKARTWGLHKLSLESTVSARPFYESLGYRAAGAAQPGFGISHCYPYEKALQPDSSAGREP